MLGDGRVAREQCVDVGRITRGLQRVIDAYPVGPVTARGLIPFGVVARRQRRIIDGAGRASIVELLLFIAGLDEDPQVAVVVAVVHHRVMEAHLGLLVALAPRACSPFDGQRCHILGG